MDDREGGGKGIEVARVAEYVYPGLFGHVSAGRFSQNPLVCSATVFRRCFPFVAFQPPFHHRNPTNLQRAP